MNCFEVYLGSTFPASNRRANKNKNPFSKTHIVRDCQSQSPSPPFPPHHRKIHVRRVIKCIEDFYSLRMGIYLEHFLLRARKYLHKFNICLVHIFSQCAKRVVQTTHHILTSIFPVWFSHCVVHHNPLPPIPKPQPRNILWNIFI